MKSAMEVVNDSRPFGVRYDECEQETGHAPMMDFTVVHGHQTFHTCNCGAFQAERRYSREEGMKFQATLREAMEGQRA